MNTNFESFKQNNPNQREITDKTYSRLNFLLNHYVYWKNDTRFDLTGNDLPQIKNLKNKFVNKNFDINKIVNESSKLFFLSLFD